MKRAAVLGVVLALTLAGGAHAAVPVKVSLKSLDPAKIVKRGSLTVKVAARRKGKVRVSAGKLAKAKTVRFKRRGRKTVRLKLTARGRRTLGACGTRRRVTIKAGKKRTRRLLRPQHRCFIDGVIVQPPESRPPAPVPAGFDVQTGCDFLDPAVCLQPWPNDSFTVADPSTPTGRRLNLQRDAMPKNVLGKPIEPGDYNRNDGFGPGSPIHTKVPGLDNQAAFAKTGLVPETDMARAFDPGQPAVVIDAETGERQLIWAELDSQASANADRNLFIRPGKNFREGRRYIVALRNLKRADGSVIEPQRAFRVYRDGIVTTSSAVEARRAHMEDLFGALGRAGIARGDLYLAWDFTVGSGQRIAGRLLGMRDKALARARRRRADRACPGVPAGRPAGPPGRRGDHARVRHVHGALLPRPGRLPAGLALRVRRRQEQRPGAARGQHDGSPTTTASSAPTPPTGPRGWRSTATACSATPPRSTSHRSARWSSASTSPTARPTGRGCRWRTSPTWA